MTVGMPAASRKVLAAASRNAFSQGSEIDTAASAPQAATASASSRGVTDRSSRSRWPGKSSSPTVPLVWNSPASIPSAASPRTACWM